MDAMLEQSINLGFDMTRHTRVDWDVVTDKFNAEFEGKLVPGSRARETKKSVQMLACAWRANKAEFNQRFKEAYRRFRDEKMAKERREQSERR